MKTISIIFLLFLSSCSFLTKFEEKERDYFLARITFYTDDPTYGKKTASGETAKMGTTVAAAKKVPYGTKYEIPRLKEWMNTDGNFEVHDRGPHVCQRKASRGKYPVIDIYVSSHNIVRKLGGKGENIFKVYTKTPEDEAEETKKIASMWKVWFDRMFPRKLNETRLWKKFYSLSEMFENEEL